MLADRCIVDVALRAVPVGEQVSCSLEAHRTCRREHHAAPVPTQELDPEVTLELRDLTGQRRLRDEETLGSPGEVELLGDRDEVAQVPQVHVHAVTVSRDNRRA